MTVQFRNLDFDPAEPIDRWPAEAIETIIDRGSLSDWRSLARAIRESPWGPAARTAERVVGYNEHYGIDALIARIIHHAREDVAMRGRTDYAEQIRSWRKQSGMTLSELARAAGTSASRLSAYEKAKVAPTTDVLGRLKHASGQAGRIEPPQRASSRPTIPATAPSS